MNVLKRNRNSLLQLSILCGIVFVTAPFAGVVHAGDKDTASAKKSSKVLLGTPELTSGIPGKGPLSEKEIKAWLSNPENHEVLEVTLPLGLSAGAGQMVGLKENPLTRAKVELGRQLYFDTRLSSDNSISCASCHHPDEGFGRHTRFGVGVRDQEGGRNSPVSYNRILSGPQFWDGRAATLEDQAVGPIANPIEMGHTHEAVVKSIKELPGYRLQFHKIFNDGVNIDNIGKAIAAFERTLVSGSSPFDYQEQLKPFLKMDKEDLEDLEEEYLAALTPTKAHPMSKSALRGMQLFFSEKVNCAACHLGPNLTDEKYHNLGVGMDAKQPDLGRYEVTKVEKDKGAFKTPTIRNVEFSAPYMHDGSLNTLEEVVEHYNKGGIPNPYLSDKVKKLNLSDQDKQDLVAFMKACSGPFTKVETGRLPQ
tara:strand:- start:594 stop:1859 length:1266 start_codon:yes stop_codon:yes gene_type:complete